MHYRLHPDGRKDGPFKIEVLKRMAAEGRLPEDGILEEVGTGLRRTASEVFASRQEEKGGVSTNAVSYQLPPSAEGGSGTEHGAYRSASNYPRVAPAPEAGKQIVIAWILIGVSFLSLVWCLPCVSIFTLPAGVFFARKAQRKGQSTGGLAFWISLAMVLLHLAPIIVLYIMALNGWRPN